MPRYVLLYHECPAGYERPSHWDLMLEVGDILRSWAIPRLPSGWEAARTRTAEAFSSCAAVADKTEVAATPIGDHRLAYLHTEGRLTGNRGEVLRIDAGTYETIMQDARFWRLALSGEVIQGAITLQESTLSL
jgi:hypothetical protein